MANFKERLKELREEKGLSKFDVGKAIGNPHTIRKYETEGINSKVKNIIDLAKFFNVTTDYLLGISDSKNINLTKVSTEDLIEEIKRRLNGKN